MKKFIAIICSALIITLIAVGCAKGVASNENQKEESLTGTISLAGSTSMEKLCEAMSESFMADNQGITVTVEYVGSGAGIESLSKGSVDIGNSSRNLKPEELSNGCVENVVALDGIAVIVDKNNSVTDISSDNLKKLYTGEIKNWKELGGADEAVVVIGREAGSGTRDAFEELLELKDKCDYAQQLDSTGAVLAKVASTPGAIGYVSLDVVDDSVASVSVDSVEANEQNILAGKYLLSRPFVMATMGDVSSQNELVQKWFEYVNSEKGKEIIKKVGLIVPVQE
ncbi:phosphate ABC transporter substrate-binding protein [Eubacterium sp.]|uniref:phosphate ABC transporter substrate-binding protein n=1 Tax=Eubacterium sp. TaxID=142586 RepID=UPI003F07AD8A